MLFSQNAYVLNDSSSEHKISQKYDSDSDILRSYVDGVEKVGPRLMPDYANVVVFYTLQDSDRPTPLKSIYLYTVPSNGFVRIVDCASEQDFFVYVNDESSDVGDYARSHCAYHKCGASLSSNGMFPVTKGDIITMVYSSHNPLLTNWNQYNPIRFNSVFTFIPGKMVGN